jgi:hypothetical protein
MDGLTKNISAHDARRSLAALEGSMDDPPENSLTNPCHVFRESWVVSKNVTVHAAGTVRLKKVSRRLEGPPPRK